MKDALSNALKYIASAVVLGGFIITILVFVLGYLTPFM